MLVLAKLGWGEWLTAVVLFLVCLLLMLIVMLQKGRGGGLTAAFGGGGGGGGAFGAKTGDVFTMITVVLAAVFLGMTVVGNYVFHPQAIAAPPVIRAPGPGAPVSQPLGSQAPVSQSQGPKGVAPVQPVPSPGQEGAAPGAGDGAKTTITLPGATAKPESTDAGNESNAGADDGGAAQNDAADMDSDEPSDSDADSDDG